MKNSPNLTQSSLRNDPINRRMQGYSFRIFEDEDGVQDANSSFSFNKSSILSIHWKRKWVKSALEQTARDLELYTRSNLEINRERVLRREEPFLNKTKMNLDRPMKGRIGSTIAITRDSIETSRHLMNVGSRSCGLDLIWGSLNIDRYNYQDRRPGWFHLKPLLSTCLIRWSGGPRFHHINGCD